MDEALKWVEEHPAISAVIGVGGTLILLYLLGVFGSSSSNAQSGQANLAAAYYAAEQAQTVAGTQLNMVQANDQAATAQALIQANAATSIASTQAGMYTTLGNQQLQGNQTLYNDQMESADTAAQYAMITANTAANDAVQTAINSNATQLASTQATLQAGELNNYVNTVFPQELANAPQFVAATPFGSFNINPGGFQPSINAMIAMGYTPEEAQQVAANAGYP